MSDIQAQALDEILAEVASWHNGTDRKEGEFTVQEYIAKYPHNEDVARGHLRDDVRAGRLTKRRGRIGGKPVDYFTIVRQKFEETA